MQELATPAFVKRARHSSASRMDVTTHYRGSIASVIFHAAGSAQQQCDDPKGGQQKWRRQLFREDASGRNS
jgi:hypothetical protein